MSDRGPLSGPGEGRDQGGRGEHLLPVRDAAQEPQPRGQEVIRHQGCQHRTLQDAEGSELGQDPEDQVRGERAAGLHLLAGPGQGGQAGGHPDLPRARAEGELSTLPTLSL